MIREMSLDDLETVMRLEHQLFSHPWTIDNYLYELNENPYGHYVVLEDNGIKGYMGLWLNDRSLQITTLGVDPKQQSSGVGTTMVDYALNFAKANKVAVITLEVRVSNTKAIHLYEKAGFKIIATRKQYYSQPDEDAALMILNFEQM